MVKQKLHLLIVSILWYNIINDKTLLGGDSLYKCEVCGREADKHHIVHRCEGGLDFPLNFKYLCKEHHRGRKGPHRDHCVDLQYKLELQNKLESFLRKEYYFVENLSQLLQISNRSLKKLLKDCKLYKEGYKTSDIIFRLMGQKVYDELMLESYEDFIPVFKLA